MMGPHTSTEGNVTQAVLPRSNLCSSAFQDGLVQNNAQVISSGMASSKNILVSQNVLQQNNTWAALPKNSLSCSMTVPQTITQGSNIQAPIPSSKLLSSPLHDGLVQSNPQEILPDVAFSDNSTMPQNIPMQYPKNQLKHIYMLMKPNQQITQASEELGQNNTHATRSENKFRIKIMVPHTSTKESDTQVALPRSNVCSSAFQDGLVQNNAQVISSGMASSNDILVSQNVLQQNNTWTALPKKSFSASMTVPQTITQGSNIQAPIPSNKLLNSPLHNGLVQNNPQEILRDVTFSNNSTMPQNIPMQYPENQLKINYMVVKPNQQITQASEELGQNNTHATRSKDKFCSKMMVSHTSTKESDTQVALPRSNVCRSEFQDGLVQNNAQVISSGMESSNDILVSQNVLQQNNTWAALPKNSFSASMTVPQTITQGSNIQAPTPSSKLLSSPLHDGLVQSNLQEILPDVAFSNNSTMPPKIPMQYPKNQLKLILVVRPNQQIALAKNIRLRVPHTVATESNIQVLTPNNMPLSLTLHDGLAQSNPQEILPGVASSNNNPMLQNFREQNNSQAALLKNKFSSSMKVPWTIVKESNIQAPVSKNKLGNPLWHDPLQRDTLKVLPGMAFHSNRVTTKAVALQTSTLADLPKNNSCIQHFQDQQNKFDISGKYQKMTSTMPTHPVVWKNGQIVKENEYLKSDCVSLSSSTSNRQLVLADRAKNVLKSVKHISKQKSLAELSTPLSKASTENMIENKEVSSALETSSMTHIKFVHAVLRKDGQDVKENKFFKSVEFHRNIPAKEAPSESDYVSLSLSNAWSSNRQPVIEDGVKNSSVKKSVAELDTSHLKASTTENMIENKEVSGEQKASNMQQTSTKSIQPVVRKDGQDMKENESLKSVRFHGNMAAGETTSEPDCVSLPSSDARSSNRQLVIDDGVKNSSIKKSVAELDTSHLKASTTENMIENKEVSGEQKASNMQQMSTKSIQPVVRKDGQDMKENESLKSVRFHGNMAAGETTSEPDCVSLPSSDARSSNRQLVIDDGVKNSSIKKSVAELDTSHLKASTTENMIENKEVSGEQKASNMQQMSTKSIQPVVRKDGQDMKENESLKSVRFYGNIAAGGTTSEPDCVSLPSSNACSSNRQLVFDDGVKNSSIKKSVAELDTSHLKASTTENMIENKKVSGEQRASNKKQTSTMSIQSVVRKDGQDVKENKSLKVVSSHGNIAAGETTSEPDCVSLSSSDACSSNRQLVIDDGVKNSSVKKSLASTKNIIENKEVSGEQQGSSTAGSDTDDEVLVIRECKSGANKCIDVVCHVCTSLVTVEKMLDMHLLFGQLKCKNCNLEIACCNMMKTYFYGNSFCSGNKHQGIHDFTVWCNDVIEYILYQLRRDLIIKNFCKYDRNIPVCDNDLYSELQDYVEKLAILRKYRPWNSALLYCDQFILSQMMSRKTYSVSNTNTHLTDSAVENSSKADLSSFQDSHSLEIICKKKETEKDLERDKAEYVRIKRKRGRPRLVASEWDFPKDKRYLKISVTGKSFSCPEECPECYFAICPSRFIMKVNDFTLKYTCVECHLPMFFVFESGEEKCKKRKRVK
ncbi:uncharacterized protein LOC135208607 [Macrobrachium nipponense]|uniref:uncharacterized protein LOC135208607 n=1 Tax=Macrobrachium nipponense TaxID=159736 RepID=UPI0030C83EC4